MMARVLVIRAAIVCPRTAPKVLYPKRTRIGARKALRQDWQIIVRLLNSILSKPMKVD